MISKMIVGVVGVILAGAAFSTAVGQECQKPPGTSLGGGEYSVVGKVFEKGQDWISIKAVNGAETQAIRFAPRSIDGAADEAAVNAIAAARVGQTVQIRYTSGDQFYIIKLTCSTCN